MKTNHEETKNTKNTKNTEKDQKKPSSSSVLRGWFSAIGKQSGRDFEAL
jgi:hypothetical protein